MGHYYFVFTPNTVFCMNEQTPPLTEVEHIKINSAYLKGSMIDSLANELSGAIADQDQHLIKFHGSYQQTDRELDVERKKQKLEPLYQFMLRVRVPGGIATSQQWLQMSHIADTWGSKTLKLTTRQAFELHSVAKMNLSTVISHIVAAKLDTLAACGDVNRNVMCTPHPFASAMHEETQQYARKISDYFTPQTTAYYEIWLNGENLPPESLIQQPKGEEIVEPIYGKTYLPRKFKIAIAVPPDNDTDIFANDIGLIAIGDENGQLVGFNVAIGGGMGMTFGDNSTYPRLGSVIGFVPKEHTLAVCEAIIILQRDHGNRTTRRNARLKYTIDRMGLDVFVAKINEQLPNVLQNTRPYYFQTNGDRYGWYAGTNEKWFLGLFIEGGRVKNTPNYPLKNAIDAIAQIHDGDFRLTGNQNLIIGNVSQQNKPIIEKMLQDFGILQAAHYSPIRLHSLACVALNLCALANAEAERYLPDLVSEIEKLLQKYDLSQQAITIRMTGCPNGCARPYLAEIGLVGRAPGKYNLYLGANFDGSRLNQLYQENLDEVQILEKLDLLFADYAKNRTKGEYFGDFVHRSGILSVAES